VSVFDQTFADFDIVVVDDGSDSPETVEVLDSLDLDRVTVLRQSNAGLPGARNAGIRGATGEFVVTLDADDMLAPNFLQATVAALDSDPNAAYAHCWAELFGDLHSIWATRPPNTYQLFMSNSVVGCVTLRKSAWQEVGGYDESMRSGNEDWDLWIRLLAAERRGVQIRQPLFRYRKHGVSMSVETEGSYETAIAELPKRLPHVYNRGYLRDRKKSDYPLLTILSPSSVSSFRHAIGDDFQHVRVGASDVRTSISRIRGKYAVLWPEEATAGDGVLEDLCLTLESQPDSGAATTDSERPIIVVRTWSLHDKDAPQAYIATPLEGSADSALRVGDFPDDAWVVPREIGGIPVQRQRPEEAGILPEWVPG
jgi:Glycosyl transferase family 2